MELNFELYNEAKSHWPKSGRVILAHQTDSHIVVYQAFNDRIADALITAKSFHDPIVAQSGFSMTRMTWIKPNFLWMMYRSKWATSKYQERIIAIWVKKEGFNSLISNGVYSSCAHPLLKEEWMEQILTSNIRLQWDPDHFPNGTRHPTRRAIQIGLRGESLIDFSKNMVDDIIDMTDFVNQQRELLEANDMENLKVPKERLCSHYLRQVILIGMVKSTVHLTMANSRYEYVKQFEMPDPVLRNTWIVVRVDGKGFHKFTHTHEYSKPNDERGLGLMNRAAMSVMQEFGDIFLAYGQSDEYSFIISKTSQLYNRRSTKLASTFVSLFTSAFVFYWNEFFPNTKLQYPPAFDSRVVCYPSDKNLRDYLSWRQVDCHINNLYNTCFCALVQSGETKTDAEALLRQTQSKDKQELLFSKFGINYNNLEPMFKRGSLLLRQNKTITLYHDDVIKNAFWTERPHLLE
ncbi:tRNA(His) guanylyltransferase-like [Thraustotheca clavata]|uniref:tRNA(His) guanylyltransferase n=1 Tax=Thraustotheca clavata TaxID=74557 RepID=A0A1V9ZWB4_9STRA|nr:tRNA(His) guanylyltransferase-like [Thraustotheca clavata]